MRPHDWTWVKTRLDSADRPLYDSYECGRCSQLVTVPHGMEPSHSDFDAEALFGADRKGSTLSTVTDCDEAVLAMVISR